MIAAGALPWRITGLPIRAAPVCLVVRRSRDPDVEAINE
jgi:hypothetical protein